MNNPYGKITNVEQIMDFFHDGMSIMFGGFGGVGSPPTIIDGILKKHQDIENLACPLRVKVLLDFLNPFE